MAKSQSITFPSLCYCVVDFLSVAEINRFIDISISAQSEVSCDEWSPLLLPSTEDTLLFIEILEKVVGKVSPPYKLRESFVFPPYKLIHDLHTNTSYKGIIRFRIDMRVNFTQLIFNQLPVYFQYHEFYSRSERLHFSNQFPQSAQPSEKSTSGRTIVGNSSPTLQPSKLSPSPGHVSYDATTVSISPVSVAGAVPDPGVVNARTVFRKVIKKFEYKCSAFLQYINCSDIYIATPSIDIDIEENATGFTESAPATMFACKCKSYHINIVESEIFISIVKEGSYCASLSLVFSSQV